MHEGGYYAILDTNGALYQVVELEVKPRERFRKWIREFLDKNRLIPDDP